VNKINRTLNSRIIALTSVVSAIIAQSDLSGLQFEAVSIKSAIAGARGGGYNISPGRINVKNRTLKDMVEFGWDLHDYQLTGTAGWIEGDHYEIVATTPSGPSSEQRRLMMQAMLADRFALKIHKEPKEVSGYALVVGKSGPKIGAASSDEGELMLSRSETTGLRTLNGVSRRMPDLASILSSLLARPVVDKTGLNGRFDFHMEWSPDIGQVMESKESSLPASDTGPSIFTALQETLGLKLETQKVQVEVIVIDHAEKPTLN
jgi:uncharacterized protein (TIGR03435 family)